MKTSTAGIGEWGILLGEILWMESEFLCLCRLRGFITIVSLSEVVSSDSCRSSVAYLDPTGARVRLLLDVTPVCRDEDGIALLLLGLDVLGGCLRNRAGDGAMVDDDVNNADDTEDSVSSSSKPVRAMLHLNTSAQEATVTQRKYRNSPIIDRIKIGNDEASEVSYILNLYLLFN